MERAQSLMSINVCQPKEEKAGHRELAIGDGSGSRPASGSTLSRLVRHGIGVHHAGMLPEVPAAGRDGWPRPGCSSVICGTDTLGVGINVPIRTVLFTGSCPSTTGTSTRLLKAREFHQIAGRAGRAGLRHPRHGDGARPPIT